MQYADPYHWLACTIFRNELFNRMRHKTFIILVQNQQFSTWGTREKYQRVCQIIYIHEQNI
jgi:hypothetical protein